MPHEHVHPVFRGIVNAMAGEPTNAPRCEWYGGCDQPQCNWDNLCAFHFDACERPEHAAAQSEWEHRSCTADCCATDEDAGGVAA